MDIRRFILFVPLVLFAGWAVRHLTAPGPVTFFQRWIDVSMGFTLALVITLLLAKFLLGGRDQADGPGSNTDPPTDDDGSRS
jgi:putative copper export protein